MVDKEDVPALVRLEKSYNRDLIPVRAKRDNEESFREGDVPKNILLKIGYY